jgi:hypothetical protein
MPERFKYLRFRSTDFGRIAECRFNVRDGDDSHYTCCYTCLKKVNCPRCVTQYPDQLPDEMYVDEEELEIPEPPRFANFIRERR